MNKWNVVRVSRDNHKFVGAVELCFVNKVCRQSDIGTFFAPMFNVILTLVRFDEYFLLADSPFMNSYL